MWKECLVAENLPNAVSVYFPVFVVSMKMSWEVFTTLVSSTKSDSTYVQYYCPRAMRKISRASGLWKKIKIN